MAKLAVIVGQIRAGNAAKKAGDIEARELRKRAGVRRAVGHREAAEEQRNAELAYSRALSIAAASGAGVSDPTVVKLFADLQAEGDFRVLSRLFVAEDEAQGIEYRSEVAQREGRARRRLGQFSALSTAVSFAEKYG
ncbi:hypothetical protein LCGC14_2000440 [marine sediment metagenome]|uniref:Uncharacterized protein n=1 Tax=marine sediment metagenome TaxID=412755 RepID=A0A0F9F3A1_9ZZZZ